MEADDTRLAQPDTGPEPGEVLDERFVIDYQVGRGGVGSVYRARRLKLELPLAVKLLHEDSAANEELRLRFEREAHAMASLSHPNIVSVTDFGVWRGRPYLVMEYLEGHTLYDRLQTGPLPIDAFVHIATQLLRGVAHAHARGLVHRDLKPANVFLQQPPDQPLHVKVLDFGFAKFVGTSGPGNDRDLTKSGVVFGTPAYMSPEQAVGEAMDARTDVYALGVMLFEMLTGSRPFKGDYPELTRQKLTEAVPRMSERAPELRLKPALDQLVMSCLARDRKQRPADAVALLEAFQKLPSPPAVRSEPGSGRVSDVAVRVAGRGARLMGTGLGKLLVLLGRAGLWLLIALGKASRWLLKALARGIAIVIRALVKRFGWLRVTVGAMLLIGAAGGAWWLQRQGLLPGAEPAVNGELTAQAGALQEPNPPAAAAPSAAPAAASREDTDVRGGADTTPKVEPDPVPTPPPSAAEAAGTGGAPAVAVPSTPGVRAPATNPWSRGALPSKLERIRARLMRGQRPSDSEVRTLRGELRDARNDPRPALLLAYAYANRAWFADAITWYRTACEIDPGARGDPRMQRELIELVQKSTAREAAEATLLELYGAEAIPGVERHLERARLTEAERQALLGLRERLRAKG